MFSFLLFPLYKDAYEINIAKTTGTLSAASRFLSKRLKITLYKWGNITMS